MATLMAASLNADSMSQEENQDAQLSQLPPPPPDLPRGADPYAGRRRLDSPEQQQRHEDDAATSASAQFTGFTSATDVPMSQASASSAASMSQGGVVDPRRKAMQLPRPPRPGVRRITEDDDDEDDDE
jgi:hypothetical protein